MIREEHFVLVAEDDPDDRLLFEEALKKCDHMVKYRFANDGNELMDYLEKDNQTPSLILLDLNMPMNGRDALSKIMENPRLRAIPLIVFTTSQEQKDVKRAYAECANSYLVKPKKFEEYVDLLNKVFAYWFESAKVPDQRP
jgi:CheY-like chemotaxis protein